MYWNHRLIKHRDGSMEIVEVMYGRPPDAEPIAPGEDAWGWSDATVYADKDDGDVMTSLRRQVEWFREALDKPVLDVSEKCDKACCKVQPE